MDKNQNPPATGGDSRRDFLRKAATATAAVASANLLKTPVYGQNQAPSANVGGANNRITVAGIGVGYGIGMNHFLGIQEKASENNTVLAAGCDLYSQRRAWMRGEIPMYGKQVKDGLKDADVYTEYRKVLDRKDIDAVFIATHDTWHARIAIEAMESGKHVYCEKPMTRYLDEAFKVHDAVKRTGKTFTIGSQGSSAQGWHKAAEMVKAGKIGQLVWAQGFYCRNAPKGEWNYPIEKESTEANIDWKTWLGPVKKKIAFSADHFHRWRKYLPYCGGLLSDLVPHRLHPLMIASGDPQFPVRVVSIGTKNVHTDKNTPETPERDVPEHVQLIAEFPNGYMITITSSTVNARSPGFVIYGHKATLNIGDQGNVVELVPERPFTDDIDAEKVSGLQFEDIRVHEKNWFDCIRNGKAPNANIDLAVRCQTVISLAEMSDRLKITCLFDEKTRKITTENGREVPALTYGSTDLS